MSETTRRTPRQIWMAVLARAARAELDEITASVKLPSYEMLKQPNVGSVMIEGRAGGTGGRFNLGEATVTRCIIRTETGIMGHAYFLGRDKRKAEIAAVLDAMLQSEPNDGPLHAGVAELATRQVAERQRASRKAAATKVEFFTLVRGE